MIWVPDRTGRFGERPHFEPDEIEAECEKLVSEFYRDKYGRSFDPAWATDDLVTLLEQHAGGVDLYADLAKREGDDVQGMTTFRRGSPPFVEIDKTLASDPRRVNRLRTTVAHECTHVVVHRPVWEMLWARHDAPSLFAHSDPEHRGRCRRDTVLGGGGTDWMEWQAGYGSGAILMPHAQLLAAVREFRQRIGVRAGVNQGSKEEQELVACVADRFQVSREAARVRLAVRRLTSPAGARNQEELL